VQDCREPETFLNLGFARLCAMPSLRPFLPSSSVHNFIVFTHSHPIWLCYQSPLSR